MTISTRKAAAMQLEAEYTQLRKQQAHGNANKQKRGNVAAKPAAGSQTDTVTLSSKQTGIETPSGLTPSKPVTFAEKTALQSLFSVTA
jgi:hypothetical protein